MIKEPRNDSAFAPKQEQPKEDQAPSYGLLLDKRYRILRLLGEGGMGAVHLAEHVGLQTQVAVKFLHLELAAQEETVRRFEQEARVAASIRHPNIIQVFDVGVSGNGDPFLVMEYLQGESVGDLLKRTGPLDVATACGILEPALLALQAAHRKGILHRDLKPENIFLAHQPGEPPVVKLIDFGLSKIVGGAQDSFRTQTGSLMGTPAYMAPEQARGASILDYRADLYSIGTILFEMLTGHLPYAGKNFTEFLANLLTEEPRSPRDLFPALSLEAEPVLRKAISKNVDERFQSATEMLAALAALPGFDKRADRLAQVSSGMGRSSVASGDLGDGHWQPSGGASRQSRIPERRSATRMELPMHEPEGEHAPARRSRRALVAGGVAVALVLVLAAVAFGLRKGPTPTPSAPSKAVGATVVPGAAAAAPAPLRRDEHSEPAPTVVVERASPEGEAAVESQKSPGARAETKNRKAISGGTRAWARGKKADSHSTRLHRGARGTEMSDEFE